MIPVPKKPEPDHFHKRVRKPGSDFLKKVPKPTTKQWEGHAYWRIMLNRMRTDYNEICAYSALWIPPATGAHTVDHFIPKSSKPSLAYEWDNYRYASLRYNHRKGTNTIIDPFTLADGWFVMDFPTLEIMPNPGLSPGDLSVVHDTIETLGLNRDEIYFEACQEWIMAYCTYDITFEFLKRKAPFIAFELKRQGLKKKIRRIMKTRGAAP
jgi:hypothetical protein